MIPTPKTDAIDAEIAASNYTSEQQKGLWRLNHMTLETESTALRASLEEAGKALEEFGWHKMACRKVTSCVCSCGLDAALAKLAPFRENAARSNPDPKA